MRNAFLVGLLALMLGFGVSQAISSGDDSTAGETAAAPLSTEAGEQADSFGFEQLAPYDPDSTGLDAPDEIEEDVEYPLGSIFVGVNRAGEGVVFVACKTPGDLSSCLAIVDLKQSFGVVEEPSEGPRSDGPDPAGPSDNDDPDPNRSGVEGEPEDDGKTGE